MLIKICLEKLLAEAVPASRHKEIREVITQCLEQVQRNSELASSAFCWVPFKLAFQPQTSLKMKEVALDALQKLVSFKLFTGSSNGFPTFEDPLIPPTPFEERNVASPGQSAPSSSRTSLVSPYPTFSLIDDIVTTLVECFASNMEPAIHLPLIKTLLTLFVSW